MYNWVDKRIVLLIFKIPEPSAKLKKTGNKTRSGVELRLFVAIFVSVRNMIIKFENKSIITSANIFFSICKLEFMSEF